MPLYQVAPTRQLPHTIELIQRSGAPRFLNEIERDQQYPDPQVGALCVVNTTVQVYNGTGWIPVGGGQPTHINNLQDVDARFPPDGALLTWSSAAQAWGWSMPATAEPECVTFADDFERADGPVGANWVLGLESGTGEAPELPTISSGTAIGPGYPGGSPVPVATMSWATEIMSDNQFIEVVFDNWYSTDTFPFMAIELYNFGGGGVDHIEARRAAQFQLNKPASVLYVVTAARSYLDNGDTSSGVETMLSPYTGPTDAQTFRLDSYADGRQVVTLNGAVIHDYVETGTPFTVLGHQQGVWMEWSTDAGRTSPRIVSISGGCLE